MNETTKPIQQQQQQLTNQQTDSIRSNQSQNNQNQNQNHNNFNIPNNPNQNQNQNQNTNQNNPNRSTINNHQAPIYNHPPPQSSHHQPSNLSNQNSASFNHPPSAKSNQLKSPSISQSSSNQSSTVIYPWSHRRLGLLPPAPFPADLSAEIPSDPSVLRPSPPPFPRYGHSINPMGTPNGSGDIYIFAGLVKDQVKNDLYVLNLAPPINPSSNPNPANPTVNQHIHNQILTVGLVETRGQIPPPRVGHASVGVGNVLIVWGGDTKSRDDEIQDDGLYLLNLSTREWTRVKVSGPCPEGRYGHSAAIIGSKFYIFAGQTDSGRFLNDLWSFDLHKLKSGAPKWLLNEFPPSVPIPSERTGHTIVTYKESIFLFGGTDGQYHYNDTWKFDATTATWKELDCIGYIPLPREGHAATLVDDVMYVLGGRGVDGKDLDDLAAFKISNQRWYMFQNMGPAPAGRSGHSMASWQGKVYVLGGESYTSARPDDPSIVHVLDTAKIKYPQEPASTPRQQSQLSSSTHKLSDPSLNHSGGSNQHLSMLNRATSNNTLGTSESNNNNQEPGTENSPHLSAVGSPSNPPTRPRRHDDPISVGTAAARRTIGPTTPSRTNSPQGQVASVINQSSSSRQSTSPSMQHARTGSLENPHKVPRSSQAINPVGAVRQSSSPVPRRVSAEITRMLNFNSSSPTSKRSMDITPNIQPKLSHQHSLSSSLSSPSSSPIPTNSAGPAKIPTASSSALSKQNGWMKLALAMAVKQGFTLPPSDERCLSNNERAWLMDFQKEDPRSLTKDKGIQRLVEALVQLKRELVKAKNQVAEQAKYSDNRFNETNKIKTAALQEASFYRVKLAAYEASSVSEINKLERQRIHDLEHRLSELVTSKSDCERRIAQLTGELEQERNLREISEENTLKSNERSEQLQALHSRMIIDYQELLNKSRGLDMNSSDSMQQYQSLHSTHRQVLAELEGSKQKLKNSEMTNEKYLLTLEHLQKVVEATSSKVDQVQKSWELTKHDLETQKSTSQDLSRELDSKLQELQDSRAKIQEMEENLKSMYDENLMLRTLNEQGISKLISSTRSAAMANEAVSNNSQSSSRDLVQMGNLGTDEPGVTRKEDGHQQQESQAVQNLSRKQLETTLVELNEVRSRNMSLENDLMNSNSEIAALRSKITNLMGESNKILAQINSKDHELQEKTRLIEAAEVKTSVLKNFLTESGLMGSAADDENGNRSFESIGPTGTFGVMAGALLSTSLGSGSLSGEVGFADRLTKRVQQLEIQLDERSRTSRELEQQYEETQKEMQLAEEKYREAHRKHEAAADEIASLVEEVQRLRSGGASSVSPASVEGHGKVEEELHLLQEKHRTLEQTHIKAVQYVKGTEKMLRRMKDELSKYKERTESLEAELTGLKRNEGNESNNNQTNSQAGATGVEGGVHGKQGMTEEMKEKLKELTNQIENLRSTSRESNLENEELQKKMNMIKLEYEKDIEKNSQSKQVELNEIKQELNQSIKINQSLKNQLDLISLENSKLNQIILNSKNSINRVIRSDEYQTPINNNNKSTSSTNMLLDSSTGSSSSSGHSHLSGGDDLTINHDNDKVFMMESQKQLDWLKKENKLLQSRCQDAEAKISLLLDHMDNRSESNRRSTGLESTDSDYSHSNYEINHQNLNLQNQNIQNQNLHNNQNVQNQNQNNQPVILRNP